jgi:hypothetical protein
MGSRTPPESQAAQQQQGIAISDSYKQLLLH